MTASRAAVEESRLLFGGRWMPLTKTMTFIEGTVDEVVASFLSWRGKGVTERTGYPMRVREVHGDLEGLLTQLQPLSGNTSRFLFMGTAEPVAPGGPWTCMFKNAWQGTDSGSESVAYAYRGFRVVTVVSAPSNLDTATNQGGYGHHEFDLTWQDLAIERGFDNRTVGVAQFESLRRWDFVIGGPVQPFEDTGRYIARKVTDRFTQEMLIAYAAAVGLRPFEEAFYAPDERGVIVEHTEPPLPEARETDLAGARSARWLDEIGDIPQWAPARASAALMPVTRGPALRQDSPSGRSLGGDCSLRRRQGPARWRRSPGRCRVRGRARAGVRSRA